MEFVFVVLSRESAGLRSPRTFSLNMTTEPLSLILACGIRDEANLANSNPLQRSRQELVDARRHEHTSTTVACDKSSFAC